jgi:hypothetical protein
MERIQDYGEEGTGIGDNHKSRRRGRRGEEQNKKGALNRELDVDARSLLLAKSLFFSGLPGVQDDIRPNGPAH